MQVIWVIVTIFAVFSRTLFCFDAAVSLPEHDEHSLDSEIDGSVRGSPMLEGSDLENDDSEFQNSTDENEYNGLGEVKITSISSIPSETNTTEIEIEVTTDSMTYVPEGRRKNQPSIGNNVTCGDPPLIAHAMVVSGKKSSYGSGAVITYSCQFGYVTDGVVRTAQCLPSERSGSLEWTKPEILCNPRSCGDPGFVNNANRIGSLFIFPSSVSYECEEGFKLRGNRIRYCQPSGTWSGTLPTCRKLSCDPPQEIENGRVTYSSLEFGSELQYQCDNGFILRKHQLRVCAANGTWSGDDPVCQDSQCDSPEAPEHGSVQVIGGKPRVDSRAIYTCDGDRVLVGSRTSICLETGEWTFPTPKCLDPCSIPEVPHGNILRYEGWGYRKKLQKLSVGTKVENGEDLYLQCERKYEPLGESNKEEHITCSNGEWSVFPRCEPASCRGQPPDTPNANLGSVNRKHGGGVVYHCHGKHFTKTRGNVTCNFGSWIGNTPVCMDTRCSVDSIPFPGLVKGNKRIFLSGQSFTPVCENKYSPAKPNSKLKCESGTWKGQLPPCTAASCLQEPPSIEHGTYKQHSELHTSIVTYECDEGFELKESGSKIQCLFGKWEGTLPTCKDSRCYQKDLPRTKGLVFDDVITPNGISLRVNCTDGFTSSGVHPFCSKGVWSQVDEPPCKEKYCATYGIANGHLKIKIEKRKFFGGIEVTYRNAPLGVLVPPSSSLYVTCNRNFKFQGQTEGIVEVSCSKGKWIPHPVCLSPGTPFKDESISAETTRYSSTTRRPIATTRIPIATTRMSIATTQFFPMAIETSQRRNLTDGLENPCTCTYLNLDDRLVAYSENQRLEYGSKVKNNDKVKFHCSDIGYHFFSGNPEFVCENCKTWHSSEYPQCDRPRWGDPIIRFDSPKTDQPGGRIGIQEGHNTRITCIANGEQTFPVWKIPTDRSIKIYEYMEPDKKRPDVHYFTAILDIENANWEHNGIYECAVPGFRTKSIEIQVMSSEIRCPYMQETVDMAVDYDHGQIVNSRASFTCKEKDSRLVGMRVLTCRSNGDWSDEPPFCKLQVKCPELEKGEGLVIQYKEGLDVGSLAVFHCNSPRERMGEVTSECKSNGQWSNPVPSCLLPTCSVEDLSKELPENVLLDMENVNSANVPYNFTIHLYCEEGAVVQGSENAKCGAEGKWEFSKPQCIRGCVSLKSPDSSLIIDPQKNVYRIGESITLSCAPKEVLSSNVERLMCLNSGWSEEKVPHCQPE